MEFCHRHLHRLGGLLLLAIGLLMAVGPAGAQSPAPDPRFGAVENFWVPEASRELGVGWERILFYWREIQPTGPDDWNTLHVLEEWLVEAEAQGQTVVGLLKNTPAWATDFNPDSGVPRGLWLPIDDPENLWAEYVRKIARYYSVRGVHHWIIWNEPEIERGVFGFEFGGSPRDYARLLKVASLVMKAEDPEAVIHLAGLTWWHDPTYLEELLDRISRDPEAAAHDFYFDTLSLHIYFRVETVPEIVEEVAEIQARFGLNKPIWINETNASPNLDPEWPVGRPQFQVDLEQQANYIIQAYALGFSSGASHISVYKLLDINLPPGGESFGLLRPDQSKRPAFYAYQNLIDQLSGFTGVGRFSTRRYHIVTFNTPRGVTRILWARTAAEANLVLEAQTDEAQLLDAYGNLLANLSAENGFYRVSLRGARCAPACDIGGAPLYLVEVNGSVPDLATAYPVPPTATPSPTLLPPTETPSPTVTPSLTPTLTATALPTATPTLTQPAATAISALSIPTEPVPSPTAAPAAGIPAGDGFAPGLWLLGGAALMAIALAIWWLRTRTSV